MKKFLLGALLALASSCFATQYAADHGADHIVLDDQALCPKEIQDIVLQRGAPMDLVTTLRGFTAKINGEELTGCWVPIEGAIALVWSDGDIGQISQSLFHRLKDA